MIRWRYLCALLFGPSFARLNGRNNAIEYTRTTATCSNPKVPHCQRCCTLGNDGIRSLCIHLIFIVCNHRVTRFFHRCTFNVHDVSLARRRDGVALAVPGVTLRDLFLVVRELLEVLDRGNDGLWAHPTARPRLGCKRISFGEVCDCPVMMLPAVATRQRGRRCGGRTGISTKTITIIITPKNDASSTHSTSTSSSLVNSTSVLIVHLGWRGTLILGPRPAGPVPTTTDKVRPKAAS